MEKIDIGEFGYNVNYTSTSNFPKELAVNYGEALQEYQAAKKKYGDLKQKESQYRSAAALFFFTPATSLQTARSRALGGALSGNGAAQSGSSAEVAREAMELARSRLLELEKHWDKIR